MLLAWCCLVGAFVVVRCGSPAMRSELAPLHRETLGGGRMVVGMLAVAASAGPLAAADGIQGTGYVRLLQVGQRWTLVDSGGRPFFSTGANHCQLFLYLKPSNKQATVERYGSGLLNEGGWFDKSSPAFDKMVRAQIQHLQDWAFNTFGYHTSPEVLDRVPDDVYFVASFNPIKTQLQYHQSKAPRPDPFSPEFAAQVEPLVAETTARYQHRRNLIGYAWTDGFGMNLLQMWAQDLRNRTAAAPAKRVWIELLQARYPDAAAAAKAYGIRGANTWAALSEATNWPFHNPPTEDEREFKCRILAKYYEVVAGLCRRYDPHHLVLGDKGRRMNQDEIAAIAPYVDLYFFESYEFGQAGSDLCTKLAGYAGKPVLYGDGGFGFRRPERLASGQGAHPDGGKGRQFATQDEAGRYYAETLQALADNPYCVGWHFCGFIEEYDDPAAPASATDPNENGFMDPLERYNEGLLSHVRPANQAAQRLRAELGSDR